MVQNRYARLAPGLFFSVYLLAFLLIEFAVNDNAALLFGAKSVNGIYSAGLCCTALGYLAFPLLRRLTKGERARLLVLTLICLLLVASVVPLMLAPRPFFLPCAFLSLLCAGYIGGMAHYFLALALQNSRCTGRVVGFAIAGESLLQFFIQSYLETAPLLIASVAVCVAAIFFIVRFPPGDWVLDNPLPYGEGGVPPGRKLAVAGATVCLMSVIVSLDDTIAFFLHAEGSVDLTGVVRLSYAGAVLLFGFVADIKKRAYLPFMAACVLAGSTLMFAFLDSPETYSINAVLLYILSASSVVYLTIAFLDLAPRTAHPELWAGMGRVLRSFSVAATAVPFIRLYDAAGHAVMMAVAFAATVAVLVLFFADGQFSPGRAESAARARGVSGLAGFAEKYGLTPRETDVLAAALYNDKAPKEIAYDLQISERIVQRYFNSIYEKTGTQGRVGLTLLYSGFTINED